MRRMPGRPANARSYSKAIARRRAVEWCGHAKDLAPPFAERHRKAALAAKLDIGQGALQYIIGILRPLGPPGDSTIGF